LPAYVRKTIVSTDTESVCDEQSKAYLRRNVISIEMSQENTELLVNSVDRQSFGSLTNNTQQMYIALTNSTARTLTELLLQSMEFCTRLLLILHTIFANCVHCFVCLTMPYYGLYTVKIGANSRIF